MIDLYTWPTPNGHKIHIMLEECGLPYNVIPIDIGAGDQFDAEFEDLAQQQDAGHGRPRRPRRRADLDVRIRRDPDLPRREDRQVPAATRASATPPCSG